MGRKNCPRAQGKQGPGALLGQQQVRSTRSHALPAALLAQPLHSNSSGATRPPGPPEQQGSRAAANAAIAAAPACQHVRRRTPAGGARAAHSAPGHSSSAAPRATALAPQSRTAPWPMPTTWTLLLHPPRPAPPHPTGSCILISDSSCCFPSLSSGTGRSAASAMSSAVSSGACSNSSAPGACWRAGLHQARGAAPCRQACLGECRQRRRGMCRPQPPLQRADDLAQCCSSSAGHRSSSQQPGCMHRPPLHTGAGIY
jgi:hypothetical protein